MIITMENIRDYKQFLIESEKAEGTISKYSFDLKEFFTWNDGHDIDKQRIVDYKEHLMNDTPLKHVTINAKISAINGFMKFMNHPQYCVKFIRIQKKMFRDESRELTIDEYKELVYEAYRMKNEKLALILQTICSTGIRVSELQYFTVEAVQKGKVEIHLKGKERVILMPTSLITKLLNYCKENNITHGEIFVTRNNNSLSRRQIWKGMKGLAKKTNVNPNKVFPHNLRHLFAVTFYEMSNDIVKLADILGHSSVNTTRIYLLSTGKEHRNMLNNMKLVC